MGGSAFSSLPDPPFTPRMPTEVYRHVLAACQVALREIFVCVATPIEGPGKKDHGDIDILVAVERRVAFPQAADGSVQRKPHELMAEVKRLLDAKYAIVHPTGTSANLGIPWPSDIDHLSSTADENGKSNPKFIQVDVRICPTIDQVCWTLFKHAHGDLWNLLGSTIRPFGLTVDEEALWLRIPEIEKFDRKKARVCLSRDPVAILRFLGMEIEGFWCEPFESVEALFDYATTCRLFYVREMPDENGEDEAGVLGGEEGRRNLKSNDRRRMNGRPVYRRWINEHIPALHAEGKFLQKGPATSVEEMRARVREEAFAHFFVKAEYNQRLMEWQMQREEAQMKVTLKELIPIEMDNQFRACLVSAMRRIVMEGDASFGLNLSSLKSAEGFYDMEAVSSFVQKNWEAVGKMAWEYQQQKARESMLRKQQEMAGGAAGK
ncbi:hypothetical protein N0V88_004485 [Collariella sp. IMI 366227]|nr:hypothetical protein N0V88_004485 [Collariella sp. IMI 366227]